MNDYLDILEKFKDIKDILDLYNEVQALRLYYRTKQHQKMQEHIKSLMSKYYVETCLWNAVNTKQPSNYEQAYINAEAFLCAQGVKLIVEKAIGYKNRLTPDEISFIESLIKPKE